VADNPNPYDRRRPRDRGLRVGDTERDAVAELLREHHVAGRLQADEFQDRLDRCMNAKTHADLDALVADLPGAASEVREPGYGRRRWRPWPLALVPLAFVAAVVLSHGHLVWLAIPLFFIFVVRPFVWGGPGRRYAYGARGCGAGHRST
jgi:Domain of unknown function (DUF1707)